MKITLEKIRFCHELSHETCAYTAILCVDGTPAFHASNQGCGGADLYRPLPGFDGPTIEEIDRYLTANGPPVQAGGETFACDLELTVAGLLDQKRARNRLSSLLTHKIVLIQTEDDRPVLYAYPFAPTASALARVRLDVERGKLSGVLVNGAEESVIARALALV